MVRFEWVDIRRWFLPMPGDLSVWSDSNGSVYGDGFLPIPTDWSAVVAALRRSSSVVSLVDFALAGRIGTGSGPGIETEGVGGSTGRVTTSGTF
jgi:hypothetical protein